METTYSRGSTLVVTVVMMFSLIDVLLLAGTEPRPTPPPSSPGPCGNIVVYKQSAGNVSNLTKNFRPVHIKF